MPDPWTDDMARLRAERDERRAYLADLAPLVPHGLQVQLRRLAWLKLQRRLTGLKMQMGPRQQPRPAP